MRRKRRGPIVDNRTPAPSNCEWCRGTGWCYVTSGGNPVLWSEQEPGDAMRKCTHGAPIQARIEYRDFTESQSVED